MTSLMLSVLMLVGVQLPPTDWRNAQAIAPGSQIKLVMKAGDVQGTFVAANNEVLVIHLKKGDFSVDRSNVKRIDQRLPGSNRVRNIGYGLGMGVIAGVLRAGASNCGCGPDGLLLWSATPMTIGTIVGATSSATKWETIYRR